MTKIYQGTLLFYRRMLKTMMKTFNGDPEMFHRVRIECRNKIKENANETDQIKIQNHIFFGEEAREFLENHLISGKLMPNGRYRFKAQPQHSMNDPIKQ
ncbi:unnamed protein product [Paramecium sonneborni]|uniref:Uncharacterized protein n=1 Tax=Paramecium sonneborni TaxID=65129 RepID=A0A8S1PNN6_9CILI|nr:unnamed protein product [Paramecium sonneborni]